MSSVGQLVVMPGAGLGTEEVRAVTVGINIMTHASTRLLWVTITFTSIMQSTILQRIFSSSKAFNVWMVGVNNDARCSDVDKSPALLSEDCVLTCTQRQQASLIVN